VATLYINDAPTNTSGTTINEGPYALFVDAGDSRFDGSILNNNLDARTATTLAIGAATATALTLGASDITTTNLGDLQINGNISQGSTPETRIGAEFAQQTISGTTSAFSVALGASLVTTSASATIVGTTIGNSSGNTFTIAGNNTSAVAARLQVRPFDLAGDDTSAVVTTAATLRIEGAPTIGANTPTITNGPYAIQVTAGDSVFGGDVLIGAATGTPSDTLDVNGTANISGGVVLASTTTSTTKDTGALIVEGGVGIEENLNVGGTATVTGVTTISDTTTSTTKDTGALIVEGGVGIEENLNVGDQINNIYQASTLAELSSQITAINSAGSGTLVLAPGTYTFTSTETITADDVHIIGAGSSTILATTTAIDIFTLTGTFDNFSIQDLAVDINFVSFWYHLVRLANGSNTLNQFFADNITFIGGTRGGLFVTDEQANRVIISNCRTEGGGSGGQFIEVENTGSNAEINELSITNCHWVVDNQLTPNGGTTFIASGVTSGGINSITISNCIIDQTSISLDTSQSNGFGTGSGASSDADSSMTITGCVFKIRSDKQTTAFMSGWEIDMTKYITITGNTFFLQVDNTGSNNPVITVLDIGTNVIGGTISGNSIVMDVDGTSSGGITGINVQGDNVIVADNIITLPSTATGTVDIGIDINSGATGCTLSGNRFQVEAGTLTTEISVNETLDVYEIPGNISVAGRSTINSQV